MLVKINVFPSLLTEPLLAFLLGYGYSSYSSGCVCIFSLRRGSKRRGQLSKR